MNNLTLKKLVDCLEEFALEPKSEVKGDQAIVVGKLIDVGYLTGCNITGPGSDGFEYMDVGITVRGLVALDAWKKTLFEKSIFGRSLNVIGKVFWLCLGVAITLVADKIKSGG